MPSYLVESYAGSSPAAADARERARRTAELDAEGVYVRTTYLPADEVILHLFEAPSAEALVRAGRQAGSPSSGSSRRSSSPAVAMGGETHGIAFVPARRGCGRGFTGGGLCAGGAEKLAVHALYYKRPCGEAPAKQVQPTSVSAGTVVLDRAGDGRPVRVSLLEGKRARRRSRSPGTAP